jgi:hypothetical protein
LVEISKLSEAIFAMTVSTKDTIYGENILISANFNKGPHWKTCNNFSQKLETRLNPNCT